MVRRRRTAWADNLHIHAEGKQVSDGADGDIVVAGRWHPGDRITCHYQPKIVIHPDTTPPTARVAVQRGPLMLAAVDIATDNAQSVDVSCEQTTQTRRIVVNLDERFVCVSGLLGVDSHCVDWDHPDRGITFTLRADGAVLPGSITTPLQGWSGTMVVGTVITAREQLVIEITSNHPDFPISAAHRGTCASLFRSSLSRRMSCFQGEEMIRIVRGASWAGLVLLGLDPERPAQEGGQ